VSPPAAEPPTGGPPAAGPPAPRGARRFLTELQASRSYAAGGIRHGGWLDFGQFNWHDAAPGRAVRAALGVIAPLAIGVAAGHAADGTYAALGALPAGFVSFRGVSRTRVNAVTVAALGMAISTFAGAATADSVPWLLVPEVMLWAYLVGLFAALGPTATVVALQWPVALLIGSALPLGPGAAAVRAGLVLAGGLWQGALVASTWALSRGSAERAAVADSYLALSGYAAGLAAGAQGPPPPVALPGTAVLRDPNPLLRTDARLHLLNLLAVADRIRATLAALGSLAGPAATAPAGTAQASTAPTGTTPAAGLAATGSLSGPAATGPAATGPLSGPAATGPATDPLSSPAATGLATGLVTGESAAASTDAPGATDPGPGELLSAAAVALRDIAGALSPRRGEQEARTSDARQHIASLRLAPGIRWQWAGEALLGQLRGAIRIAESLNDAGAAPVGAQPASRGPGMATRPAAARAAVLALRASTGSSTEAGRHALRLAAVAGAAEVLVRATGLPHGYWAVLTVFLVLKPDYSSTLYRGVQRAAGTAVGAGLGVATALLARTGISVMLAVIGISLVASYAVFTVNYLLYAVFLTDFVVVLLAMLGLPADQTALYRLAGTAVGAALALLAYLLWPSWEGSSASEKFAGLFEAQGRYASALLRAYSRPGSTVAGELPALQLAARRARSDAEASADRLADEPDRPPMTGELARLLTSAVHRMAQGALTLDAVVAQQRRVRQPQGAPASYVPAADNGSGQPAGQPQAALDELAAGLAESAGILAASLRGMRPPGQLPPLRRLQAATMAGDAAAADGLFAATDGLVDAVDTAADILRGHLDSDPAGP